VSDEQPGEAPHREATTRFPRSLEQTEEICRLLIEGVREYAIFMLDGENRVTSWNHGAERILGYAEGEILGRPGAVFFTPEDRDAGEPEKEMRQAVTTGQACDDRWHVRKDGSRFWANGIMTALRDEGGGLRGFAKIMRDNTERKQMEDDLREAKRAAEEANRSKDDFLATVSHELRTPLTAILSWVRLLRTEPVTSPMTVDAVNAIERSAAAQSLLIEDILDLSRIISGKFRLHTQVIDPIPVIEGAVDSLRPSAETKGIALRIALPPSGHISADPARVEQVVGNILTNAIKFTPAGGQIVVRAAAAPPHFRVAIEDTGVGIAPEFLGHVFDRFRQADSTSTRNAGGLGLGLAIARHIVELHGGTIEVASEGVGKGATFTVELPLAEAEAGPRPAPAADAPAADAPAAVAGPAGAALAGVHVLLVEDEPELRRVLKIVLQREGATVSAAGSAREALDLLKQLTPDVLISDIGMPGEDGYSLIRKVRLMPPAMGGGLPAAALTAYTRPADRQRVLEAGFQDFLAKPVHPNELVTLIARLAGRVRTPKR
jgi:PAS domain S-box-containing protein